MLAINKQFQQTVLLSLYRKVVTDASARPLLPQLFALGPHLHASASPDGPITVCVFREKCVSTSDSRTLALRCTQDSTMKDSCKCEIWLCSRDWLTGQLLSSFPNHKLWTQATWNFPRSTAQRKENPTFIEFHIQFYLILHIRGHPHVIGKEIKAQND